MEELIQTCLETVDIMESNKQSFEDFDALKKRFTRLTLQASCKQLEEYLNPPLTEDDMAPTECEVKVIPWYKRFFNR